MPIVTVLHSPAQVSALASIQVVATLGVSMEEFEALGGSQDFAADVAEFAQLPGEGFVSVVRVEDLGAETHSGRQGLTKNTSEARREYLLFGGIFEWPLMLTCV